MWVTAEVTATSPAVGPTRRVVATTDGGRTARRLVCVRLIRKRSSGKALQVGTFQAVALPAEQLEVVDGGRTAEGHRDEVVVLKVNVAAAWTHWPPSRSKTARRTSRGWADAAPAVVAGCLR